ncbi:MAG: TIGR00725 family protein [Deltaproteobacteria bacterium]|nr:TIGR00725 family protein [Deltaproteobacteria bacterium]
MGRAVHVGVIGAGECSEAVYGTALKVGAEIARQGWVLISGGLGGVMEAAAKGCKEAGGTTVGILPGLVREAANPHITIPLATGLGEGRNILVVRASDALIAIAGGYGTLSEIAFGLKLEKPVIGLDTWKDIRGVQYASSPEEAVQMVIRVLSSVRSL